jgi:M6 family metalloprotease-like protein
MMLPKPSASYGISKWGSPGENRRAFERDAIGVADNAIDYSRYRVVFIVAAGRETVWAYSTSAMIRTNDNVTVEAITVQSEYTPWGTFAHEFGHQLGLPDLYDYTVAAKPGVYLEAATHVGPYCLMSRSNERPLMLGWCKLTLGWIPPSNMYVAKPGDEISIKINPHRSPSNETTLLKIPISPTQYYLVEVRDRMGYDSVLPDSGVLVTFINELAESGHGPVKLIDANPTTKSLDDAPFDLGPGENSVFTDLERGIRLALLQKARDGYVINLTKAEKTAEHHQSQLTFIVVASAVAVSCAILIWRMHSRRKRRLTVKPQPATLRRLED